MCDCCTLIQGHSSDVKMNPEMVFSQQIRQIMCTVSVSVKYCLNLQTVKVPVKLNPEYGVEITVPVVFCILISSSDSGDKVTFNWL